MYNQYCTKLNSVGIWLKSSKIDAVLAWTKGGYVHGFLDCLP